MEKSDMQDTLDKLINKLMELKEQIKIIANTEGVIKNGINATIDDKSEKLNKQMLMCNKIY